MKKKKKIIFVLPSLKGGGAERVAVNVINNLDKKKYEIVLVLFKKEGPYIDCITDSIRIIDLKKRNKYDLLVYPIKLCQIFKHENADLVVSFLDFVNIITVISSFFVGKNLNLIISERNQPSFESQFSNFSKFRKLLIKLCYPFADKIVTVSDGVANALEEQFFIKKDKLTTIYNPVEITNIRKKSLFEATHDFFDAKYFTIISVGRLEEQKNYELLINAFYKVQKKIDKSKLLILGKGCLENKLKKQVERLGLNNHVDFVGFQDNPYAWIKKSNLFVLSSNFEGFPNVILEAMACGIPIISTDCPSGPNELITDNVDGILVPVGDADKLAAAIMRLHTDHDLLLKLTVNGEIKAEEYDVGIIIAKYESIFDEILFATA